MGTDELLDANDLPSRNWWKVTMSPFWNEPTGNPCRSSFRVEKSTSSKPLSSSTVHQHLIVLSEALDEAEHLQLVSRNPLSRVKSPVQGDQMERRALTDDEIRKILAAAQDTPLAPLLRFALATGLRIGEMLGLTWTDVGFSAGTVLIQRNARFEPGVGVVMDQLKTKNA
jgi:integrase